MSGQKKNPHYLILALGVSIPQRHKHTHAHTEGSALMREMGIHLGHGISWGRNTKPMLQSAAVAQWEYVLSVCEREMREGGTRQGSQAATTRPKDVPLLFFQTFPVGTLFWLYSPFCLLSFYFFPSSFAPISLPALPSRSDCWGARIYLFSHCCSNLP